MCECKFKYLKLYVKLNVNTLDNEQKEIESPGF